MSWLAETAEQTESKPSDDKWLKIPDAEAVNKSTEVTIRILESEPQDVWRHWLNDRMFNCPGMNTCPVCKVRNPLLKIDKEAAQKQYRTDHRFFFNVLHDGKVKIFSFGPGVAKQLMIFDEKYADKYGNITSYDVTVIKRKTGKLPQNVEYTVVPEVPARALTEEEAGLSETRYDLEAVVTPASRDDLLSVAQGELPTSQVKENGEDRPKMGNGKATKADIIMLKALVEAKGFELAHFGITDGENLDKTVVEKLIAELRA